MASRKLRARNSLRAGFTLLELMVVIVLIGAMATLLVPYLRRRPPQYARKQFVEQLGGLTQYAWERAVQSNALHRVLFDFEKKVISIQVKRDKKKAEENEFGPIVSTYLSASIAWPDHMKIKNFYIDTKDQMYIFEQTTTVFFYLMPNGLAQDVIINMIDKKDIRNAREGKRFALVLNPFTIRFKEYDEFQKP